MKLNKIISFLTEEGGDFKHKIIRSSFWMVLANTIIRILEFVRSIILARLLTPEIFGIWGIVNFIRQGIEVFTQTGFGAELIHRQKRVKEAADVAWTLNILRGFILTIICFVLAPYVARFYHTPVLEVLLRVVGISFLIRGFSNINVIFFQKELEFKKIAALQQSTVLIGLVVTLLLAFLWRNVWALVWGTLAYFTADLILSYIIQKIKPKIHFEKDLLKEIFRYGIFITASGIVIFLTTELDNAFVGKMLGMKALGFYTLAYTLANLPATEITHVVSKVMFPAYSQLQGNKHKLKLLYLKTLKLVSTFTIPAAVGIGFLAQDIVSLIYGYKWIQAIPSLRILCIFGAIRSLAATAGPVYNAIGLPKIPFILNTLRLFFILLTIYPLTDCYGIKGTAYCVTISIIVTALISWKILSKLIKLSNYDIVKALLFPLLNSGIMIISLSLIKMMIDVPISFISLCFLIIIGILIYVITFSVLQPAYIRYIIGLVRN